MAKRPAVEQLAIRRYAEGRSMEEISQELGVSLTSLYKWRAESKAPGEPCDEWDRARAKKGDLLTRTAALYEDQLSFMESVHASERSAPMFDALAKCGSLVGKWNQAEEAIRQERARAKAEAMKAVEAEGSQVLTAARVKELLEAAYGA